MERNDGTERGNGTARHAHVLKMQWWDFSNVVEIVVEIYIIYIVVIHDHLACTVYSCILPDM